MEMNPLQTLTEVGKKVLLEKDRIFTLSPWLVAPQDGSSAVFPLPFRQEELHPSPQGPTRPQLRRLQLPGERDHPTNCTA